MLRGSAVDVQRPFATTALFVWGAPLVWAADFLCAYVLAAFACARDFSHLEVFGWPLVRSTSLAFSVLACVAIVLLLLRALRRTRSSVDATSRMLAFTAAGLGMLALVATIFSAMPRTLAGVECG